MLQRLLAQRDHRAHIQKTLSERWHSPLVSFSLNMPGLPKITPLARTAFEWGLSEIRPSLTIREAHTFNDLSWIAAIEGDAFSTKIAMTAIENTHELGRFFDIDVLDETRKKLSRSSPRLCFLCPIDAADCARSQRHSVHRLRAHIHRQIVSALAETMASLAVKALIDEVETTPKPGLVDRNNSGAHADMDLPLFIKSAHALRPYFFFCAKAGFTLRESPSTLFSHLRELGKEAERDMFRATQGVNTHKGAIFSLGILIGAMAQLLANGTHPSRHTISHHVQSMCARAIADDFKKMNGKTHGERAYLDFGIEGARGEAMRGFPLVRRIGLPTLRNGNVHTFMALFSHSDDTNVIARAGIEVLQTLREKARDIVKRGCNQDDILELDRELIQRHIGPGGTADQLALTLLWSSLETMTTSRSKA